MKARKEIPVKVCGRVRIPLANGATGTFYTFERLCDDKEHFVVGFGEPDHALPVPVRLHSECLTGDIFGSQRCDCGPQLRQAINWLTSEGGYLVYLRQEGRGIGLYAKLEAYRLQREGLDTYDANLRLNYPADLRDYTPAAQMLAGLGITTVRLLTNNPDKVAQLERLGIAVAEQVRTGVFVTEENHGYLSAKAQKGGHTIDLGVQVNMPDEETAL